MPSTTHDPRSAAVARNLERLAWLMDRAVKIPGTRMTVGLDAVLGLLPIGGDVATGLVQTGLVLVALHHYRVPKSVALRMGANVLLDVAVGAIPLVGDLFDVAFKANTRNLRLLEPYRQESESAPEPAGPLPWAKVVETRVNPPAAPLPAPRPSGTPLRIILPIALVLLSVLLLVVIGFVTIVRWLVSFT